MTENIFSPSWYRVAQLRPELRAHGEIHRHEYRGDVWYVLQDHLTGRSHRFTPETYQFLGALDGKRTVAEIWQQAAEALGDDAPTQDEAIRLLGQLHAADLLLCDVPPDALELFQRFESGRRKRWVQKLTHPLAIKIPLFDPERLLQRGLPIVNPLFTWYALAVWLAVVGVAVVLAANHWTDLSQNVSDRVLAPQNLILLWFVYPFVKALHEFGHAFATKAWGGEVHEMGVMLLVFVPVPYVEASAASAFRNKRHRIVVSAAGIMVELFLAAIALFVWLNVESGIVSAIAYSTMLIGSVSTLLFNGNPLLRFDGYYVLADALEIPNLASRSNTYLSYLVQRYAFRSEYSRSPATNNGERAWFLFYGIASFFYRMFILFVIILFVAGKFFVIGALLAVWAAVTQVALPIAKSFAFVFTSPVLGRSRARSVMISVAVLALLLVVVFGVPVPQRTVTKGMVWLPEQSQVRAGTDGFVVEVVATPGTEVQQGDVLVRAEDPYLTAQLDVDEAKLRELEAQLAGQQFQDRVAADVIRKEIEAVTADMERTRERLAALTIRSGVSGTFALREHGDLVGRFLRRGEVVGYVIEGELRTVRVALGQDDIGLMRERIESVELRPVDWGAQPRHADVVREVPGGSFRLPDVVLGTIGGGEIAVEPGDASGLNTIERVFQFELTVPGAGFRFAGQHVDVMFVHGRASIGSQLYRSARQLFLSRFSV